MTRSWRAIFCRQFGKQEWESHTFVHTIIILERQGLAKKKLTMALKTSSYRVVVSAVDSVTKKSSFFQQWGNGDSDEKTLVAQKSNWWCSIPTAPRARNTVILSLEMTFWSFVWCPDWGEWQKSLFLWLLSWLQAKDSFSSRDFSCMIISCWVGGEESPWIWAWRE